MIKTINSSKGAQWTTRCQRLALWATEHPYLAIFGMAIFASVLSSYPVVFFGKSFVSPNNGIAFLLYDRYPTLPGYTSTVVENVKGADVGAVIWAHLPYSVVQGRAIFEDGELPLWNRFNSTGVTLLGQGQSMLGDPLHMVVVLAKGASWAWDIKFVTAKMLFALGLGLIIYTLTRNLAISLLLTLSSAYISFFAFRFNHPAIFSMAYAPWILYFWIRSVQIPADKISTAVFWLSGLILANWTVMNSGTAKEAYMLLVSLNFTGLLIFLFWKEENHAKLRKAASLLLAQALFVLISAPVWFTFLDNIRKSYSSYDVPRAIQIPPSHFIGIFDDIFYRQLVGSEQVTLPAANFLILVGVLWAAVRFKRLMTVPAFLGTCLGAAIPLSLAFGIVPENVITQIPFVGNVVHIGNTFSVVLIVHLVVLAGFGLQACWERFADKRWPVDMAITIAMFGLLLVLYFSTAPGYKSLFFVQYGVSLVLAFAAFPLLARHLAQKTTNREIALLLLLVCLVALHWRHGMYLKTWADDYVMNPQVRVNLQPESAAIKFIKQESPEPFRAVGFGENLVPGYNAAAGVESIYGPDALINRFYREFTKLLPLAWQWDWRIIVQEKGLERLKPVYDFLNVKYYLSRPNGKPAELLGLRLGGRFDLDVYQSDTVWPRAFFTNGLSVYKSPSEFARMVLYGDGRPFAAMEDMDLRQAPSLKALVGVQQREVVPATKYKLTNNTTTFTVTAPGSGIIVLTEAYSKDDFKVTLNGKRMDYFRINHVYKGVKVDAAGAYTVVVAYWPRHFSLLLLISGAGLLILLIIWLFYYGIDRK
jgi:hypothetical protein